MTHPPSTGRTRPSTGRSLASDVMLAVVRVGVALMWIQNAAWKVPPDFGREANRGLFHFSALAVEHPVFPPYSAIVDAVLLPNIEFFGWGVLLVEAALGAFLLIGLATRFWAIVGLAQIAAITLSVLNAPNEWHWSYYLMALVHLALLATAAGRSYGLDGLLRPAWLTSSSRWARLMARCS